MEITSTAMFWLSFSFLQLQVWGVGRGGNSTPRKSVYFISEKIPSEHSQGGGKRFGEAVNNQSIEVVALAVLALIGPIQVGEVGCRGPGKWIQSLAILE